MRSSMRILSGIQPSGKLHLGNYLGAIRQHLELQEKGDAFFFIADLHALTTVKDPELLRENVRDVALDYLALGLDPAKAAFYRQSDIHEIPELAWLLTTVTPMGLLERCTSYKDKIARGISPDHGLFSYPVLMAADIVLYDTDKVPVGDDQRQHLELARNIAQRFNSRFGEVLKVPEAAIPGTGGRVMDLQDPMRKMSTTNGTPQGTILLTDPADVVVRKIRSAVTDSGREVRRAGDGKEGIANLIEILAVATDRTPDDVEASYDGAGYGQFKSDVADAVEAMIGPMRQRYLELRADEGHLLDTLAAGAEQAQALAAPKLAEIKKRMGFV